MCPQSELPDLHHGDGRATVSSGIRSTNGSSGVGVDAPSIAAYVIQRPVIGYSDRLRTRDNRLLKCGAERSIRSALSQSKSSKVLISLCVPPPPMEKLNTAQRTWTRPDVATRILAGETLFIYRGNLVRVPPTWLEQHPGGALAILHYVGRDATDEVEAFHPDHTLDRIRKYAVGRVEVTEDGFWEPMIPPVESGWVRRVGNEGKEMWIRVADVESPAEPKTSSSTVAFTSHNYAPSEILLVEKKSQPQTPITSSPDLSTLTPPTPTLSATTEHKRAQSFRALHRQITQAGLYETRYITGYGPEVLRYLTLGVASYVAYQCRWFLLSAVFLGLLWHQLTFTVHDLGHMGVTHHWVLDRLIAISLADFIGGLSIGWWVDVSIRIHTTLTLIPLIKISIYRTITSIIVSTYLPIYLTLPCTQSSSITS